MAKIPVIDAQNITPPPGTAGLALLGKTGVSAIPIETPLTAQMNPAAFGKEGEAIAKGAETILNTFLLPRLKKERADRDFQQFAQTSMKVTDAMSAFEIGMESDIANRDIVHESMLKQNEWMGDIAKGIQNKRYRAAATANFASRISALRLKAANLTLKHSNARSTKSYQKNIIKLAERLQLPTRVSTPEGDIHTSPNWDLTLTELETLEGVLQNSGLLDTKKQELIENGRLQIFNQIIGKMKLTDPERGAAFIDEESQPGGLIHRLLGGVGTGGEAMQKAREEFNSLVRTQMEHQNKLDTFEHNRNEQVAQFLWDSTWPGLFESISKGNDQTRDLVWLETHIKPMARNANRLDEYNKLYDFAKASSPHVGKTDPKVKLEVLQGIFQETINVHADIIGREGLTETDQLAAIDKVFSRKRGQWMQDDPIHKLGKALVEKLVGIPADAMDDDAKAARGVALGRWMDLENKALRKGPEWTQKHIDWYKEGQAIFQEYGRLHSDYANEHTQTYFSDMQARLPERLQQYTFKTDGNFFLYDFERMQAEAHKMRLEGTLKGEAHKDAIKIIDAYRRIIGSQVLHAEMDKIKQRVPEDERGIPKWMTKPIPPTPQATTQVDKPFPASNIVNPAMTAEPPKAKEVPVKPVREPSPEFSPQDSTIVGQTSKGRNIYESKDGTLFLDPSPYLDQSSSTPAQKSQPKFSPLTTKVIGQTSEGRNIYENEDGSQSSERSVTFEVDGKFYNWPTIFGGVELSPKQAIRKFHLHNGLDPETNIQSQPFNSEAEAIQAAEERSEKLKPAPAAAPVPGNIWKDTDTGQTWDPSTMPEADLADIQNLVVDFVEGKFYALTGDYSVAYEKGVGITKQLTNRGIARKIYEEFPEDFKRNPNDEELAELLKKYMLPYKESE